MFSQILTIAFPEMSIYNIFILNVSSAFHIKMTVFSFKNKIAVITTYFTRVQVRLGESFG